MSINKDREGDEGLKKNRKYVVEGGTTISVGDCLNPRVLLF